MAPGRASRAKQIAVQNTAKSDDKGREKGAQRKHSIFYWVG